MASNVELVRALHAAWERGDFSSVDWAHPEIEFAIADGPAPGSWTGLAAMGQAWREYLSTWEAYSIGTEAYRELDDERVLALTELSGRGKSSGLEVGQVRTKAANLYHLSSGNVTRLVLYFDRERALAELGLPQARSE
jgi:hypothetical protein